jgi:hypothetical protein
MELLELKGCDIYRDGGSLEGIWSTSENEDWAISLVVDPGPVNSDDFDNRHFTLYNCRMIETGVHQPVEKSSRLCREMIDTVRRWIEKNQAQIDQQDENKFRRAFELWSTLSAGNKAAPDHR